MSSRTKLRVSLFERIVELDPGKKTIECVYGLRCTLAPMKPVLLQTQFRMHPLISEWPNQTFYKGMLLDGVSLSDRVPPQGFPWIKVAPSIQSMSN